MARLTNLGPGDLLDRLTILALKILHKGERDHWGAERAALLAKLASREVGGKALEGLLALAAVNAALWAREDELRTYRDAGGDVGRLAAAGEVGLEIQRLNDQRAQLIDQINQATGDFLGAEK